jgi:hypothetical protein
MAIDPHWAIRVSTAMGRMAEVFDTPLTTERVDAYVEALADIPAEALEVASKVFIAGSKWFPKPIEWRHAAEAWERIVEEEKQRRRSIHRERTLMLTAAEDHELCSPEENLEQVRAIRNQFRYLVAKPLDNRPHNRERTEAGPEIPPAPGGHRHGAR